MSPIRRKPRPLVRDTATFRDDRLFIVACDDTYAPEQYFGFFQIPRVRVHVEPTSDGTSAAEHVLKRLLQFDHEADDELWMLLDTDHYAQGTHLAGFTRTLSEARRQGVHVALSKPCFEVWLLLHRVDEKAVTGLERCKDVEDRLNAELREYNKNNLKPHHYPLASVRSACERAAKLDITVAGGEIPAASTTRVYELVEDILSGTKPWELPS